MREGPGREPENCQCEERLRDETELIRFAYALGELGIEVDALVGQEQMSGDSGRECCNPGSMMINEVTYVGDVLLEPLHSTCTQDKPEFK